MSWEIGLDLGTDKLRIADALSDETRVSAAALAYRAGRERPICGGDAAEKMRGRESDGVRVETPLRDGVLENPAHAREMIRWALAKTGNTSARRRCGVMITCAPFSRKVQMSAMLDAALAAGAYEVCLARSDTAAAIGAGLDVLAPEGKMLVDIGAGKMTASLFTMGQIAAFGYVPYGMDRLDERIRHLLRQKYGFRAGKPAIREIKHTLGGASKDGSDKEVITHTVGFDLAERIPKRYDVDAKTVLEVCEDLTKELAHMCQVMLAGAPEELLADLNDAGCVLTGGGAQLPGIAEKLKEALGIECRIADAAEDCAIRGLKQIMAEPELYEDAILTRRTAAPRRQM